MQRYFKRGGCRAVAGALLGAVFLGLSACTTIKDQNGYLADKQMIGNVSPGVDNRDSVLAMLGRPSITGTFDDRTWYYVSQMTRQIAFMTPKPIQHEVVAIRFDEKGNVVAVDKFDRHDIVSVDPVGDKTPTRAREMGFLEQLFGNIGRFGGAPPGGAGGRAGGPN
ncbi:MAG: outer membrane protein assembly factor BamE [Pseudomonadota bacterium]